ncbi:MAG: CHC2 zinc finger domain-containing protein, partial [Methyloligellaceae bacterium]
MRFDDNILSEIKARIPVSQIVSATVKLKRQGREFIGLSPFKNEKTPSFTVNDQKGFYHCFASGEHGDIFSFLMKVEGLSFPEAVEKLAAIAGVALPKPTEQDREKSSLRQELIAIHEKASAYFEEQLRSVSGREAREYLIQRGIEPALQKRFRIGYAPNDRTALKTFLREAGFKPESIALSGMVISGEDIAVPYDRFRHRITFPI